MREVLLFAVPVEGPISAQSAAPPIPCHPEKFTLKSARFSMNDWLAHGGPPGSRIAQAQSREDEFEKGRDRQLFIGVSKGGRCVFVAPLYP
jgi:hypothetical protein